MEAFHRFKLKKTLLLFSIVIVILVVYPNITNFITSYNVLDSTYFAYFTFRCLFYIILTYVLLFENIYVLINKEFSKRLIVSLIITIASYGINLSISLFLKIYDDPQIAIFVLLFQSIIINLICVLVGYIFSLQSDKEIKEKKIKQLKIENLQSKCDALANQISPHFFFNSLNGLTGLVENEQALEYINKLSGIFR